MLAFWRIKERFRLKNSRKITAILFAVEYEKAIFSGLILLQQGYEKLRTKFTRFICIFSLTNVNYPIY
ncbi:MAG: hypothetical protein A3I29_04875 [Candidatus Magasanikbacteria bacterium RIFCSPLOWO2_02_FULL_44_11]|uniref:Uncharacterized protein n=2 Tax=Candidatus Magasanikiibacteriota TaxID=1752731 RepID=A0A1F6NA30_9BACT|nr:MAG: hypothetical protein A3D53_02385 [Candidatus Magasanikbacteria bacterium RIFCSPHIGHO2_02_FULL_45_10]OGH80792.1 MAG: hypothetical protein A3I29_04875 [Candidatus Magasanikbacteria bacterium RIFCSPLOWO2_02_FULL_44_11]